jgi:two-component system, chemotaxis family, CheB/CheR fusion protein
MAGEKEDIQNPTASKETDDPVAAPEPAAPAEAELPQRFPIVGIGASAGGLAAFEAFFSAMPADTDPDMAFVLVQHLSPHHKSMLTDLVKRYTRMHVLEVQDGMKVEPNCVYIIPPNRDMALLNGSLQLLEPVATRGLRLPIDFFFRSLAQDQGERAICIVLSGTGSDGTLGVREVKGQGGLAMAQSIDSTKYDGMPHSAIATGLVDYVLPPAEMPAQLMAYASHAFGRVRGPVTGRHPQEDGVLKKICIVLRHRTGHDFSQYKPSTLERRVERRMAIHQIDRAATYLRFLRESAAEAEKLFGDLLIGVTGFFRDPEAFEALRTKAIPGLFANKPAGATVRVWVCGSSTGEEAYSIAILMQEHLEELKRVYRMQVFATDIDPQAIEKARAGVFPASIAADVTPERLARFFVHDPESGVYRIHKNIRDLLIFSEQDVLRDPPFSKLDLVSCRNLLIYLNAELHKKLIPMFNYALNPEGVLFLGTSETVGEFLRFFAEVDRKWKLYRKIEDAVDQRSAFGATLMPPLASAAARQRQAPAGSGEIGPASYRTLTEQTLLQHNDLVGVLVTARGEILHICGLTGRYLEPAPGDITINILAMARKGLRRPLTTALHRAVAHKEPVNCPGLRIKTNGDFVHANLTVRPVSGTRDLYLVIIAPPPETDGASAAFTDRPTDGSDRIAALEQALQAKEEYLQAAMEEMETSNEELKSTNEELQSINEELQSTNEELETSKEELQSVNEELSTVNAELQVKVIDLSRANNDMNNLLAGTGIGTLFVDHQLQIARFTPSIVRVLNLIGTDVGRPVAHIASNLEGYDRLVQDIEEVLDNLVPREAEVRTKAGVSYLMRVQPYRTLNNVIEGAVISFVDISEIKRLEAALKNAHHRLCADIVATMRQPLIVLDEDLRVRMANRSFYTRFQVIREETEGRLLYELGGRQWDIPELRRLLEEILPQNNSLDNYEVSPYFEHIGRRTMLLNARRIVPETGKGGLILLAIDDVTASASPPKKAPDPKKRKAGARKERHHDGQAS